MKRFLLQEAAVDRYWQMMQPVYTKVIPSLGMEEVAPGVHQDLMNTQQYARGLVNFAYDNLKKQDRVTWFVKRARIAIIKHLMEIANYNAREYSRDIETSQNPEEAMERSRMVTASVRSLYQIERQEMNSILAKSGVADGYRGIRASDISNEVINIQRTIQRASQSPLTQDKILPHEWTVLLSEMAHFFSQDIPGIQNYTIDNIAIPWTQIKEDLREIEEEYKNRASRFIPMGASDVEPTVIVQYENGSQWLNLNKSWCDLEGRAMGHCGNSATGSNNKDERVLSYRTIEKNPITKKKEWVPHLTFVLDENGFLSEMKGRNNQKPNKKYHGVIVDLLRLPMIKGIEGGGYMPENNFSMNDLPDEVAEQLMEEKPALADLKFLYRKYGINDKRTQNEISLILDKYDIERQPIQITNSGDVILYSWNNIQRFASEERNGFPELSKAIETLLEGDFYDFRSNEDMSYEIELLFMSLSFKERQKIFDYIIENVDPDIIKEWENDGPPGELTTDGDDLYRFFFENEGEPGLENVSNIFDAARVSMEHGIESGISFAYRKEIMDWFKNADSSSDLSNISPYFVFKDEEMFFDSTISLMQNGAHFVELLTEETDFLDLHSGDWWIDMFDYEDLTIDISGSKIDLDAALQLFREELGDVL